MKKRVLLIVIVAGMTALFVWQGSGLFALAKGNWQVYFHLEDTPGADKGSVEKESPPPPLFFENREQAANFQPQLKPLSPGLVLPTAHASAIIDADSGAVLYENNGDANRQIASLTKLFTATIIMEDVKNLDEYATIGDEVYLEGTRVGCPRSGYCNSERMHPGEQLTIRDLLKAALMNSANDAATALGKHISGTPEAFAELMNKRGKEIGLEHSHFCTPSGLEIDGHEDECYSSALDVARIAAAALKYPELWEIMRMNGTKITSKDGKYTHDIFNTDQLLGQVPNLIGTKTGFTPLAGRSLLAVASDPTGKHRVIAVVLDDQSRWQSVQRAFDWAFQAWSWQ